MEINNVVTQLLARQNLSDAEMEYQEACSMLLTWIQEHPAEAGEYFPAFSKEEDQMKLLTPRGGKVSNTSVTSLSSSGIPGSSKRPTG